MKKTLLFICLLFVFFSSFVWSQDLLETNMRIERPVGIAFYPGGPSIIGISLSYYIIPNLDLELNLGANLSSGVKYHFMGHKPIVWSPYVGFSVNAKGSFEGWTTRNGLYFPIGVHYIGNKGFSFSIEAGAWHLYDQDYKNEDEYGEDETGFYPWGGIKIGMQVSK